MILIILINVLILTGLALLAIQNLVSLFVCSGIAAGCGLLLLYVIVRGTYGLRFTWLLASSLLIGYGGGSFSTIFNVGFSDLYDAFSVFGIPKPWGAYAMVLVVFSCTSLLVAGFFESPVLMDNQVVKVGWKQERFLWFGMAVIFVAYVHGDYTFMGTAAEQGTGTVSVLGEVAGALAPLLLPLAVMGALQAWGLRRRRFVFLTLVSFVALLPAGRRVMVYTLIVCALAAFRLSGWKPRLTATKKVLLGFAFVILITLAGLFFMALRLAAGKSSEVGQGGSTYSIRQMVPVLIEDILTDPGNVIRETRGNLEERPFLLEEYLSLLGRGGNTTEPMYGQDFMLGIKLAIPDAAYKWVGESKNLVRSVGTEENLANERYGLPDTDDANSILTSGIIDFGLLGVFLYPLAICGIFRVIYFVIDHSFNKEGQLVALLIGVYLFLQAESEVASYVLSLRNMVIVMVLWRTLYEVPTLFRLSAAARGGSADTSFST